MFCEIINGVERKKIVPEKKNLVHIEKEINIEPNTTVLII